ncbi:MAG: hypothetical protein NTV21_21290 [Planctomycetota bacterium]|nr:hypothetical protein [Planctomycetota bacterium]
MSFLLARTAAHGPGLDFDSAHHLAAAASLLEGRGWMGVDGEPYVLWPPLFPALIALVARTGLGLGDAVRALNAACLVTCTLLAARLAWRIEGTRLAAALAAIGVAWIVLPVAAMAWSESVFLAFLFAALLAWERWIRLHRGRDLAWLALACTALPLVRYLGVFLLALVCLALLLERDGSSFPTRLRRSLAVGSAASLAILAWLGRNASVATERTARRGPPSDSWSADAADLLAQFVPVSSVSTVELVLAIVASLLAVAALVLALRGTLPRPVRLIALFPFVHGVGLLLLRHVIEFDPIDARLMAPAHAVAACCVALLLARALIARRPLALVPAAAWIVAAATVLLPRLPEQLTAARNSGIGVYDSPRWTSSECAAALRTAAPSGAGYSNDPCAVFLLTGRRLRAMPLRPNAFPRLYQRWSEAAPQERWILWFRLNERSKLPLPDASLALPIEKGPSFADADIWLLRARGLR